MWGFDLELAPNPPLAALDVALEVLGVVVAVAALWLFWWVREAFPARSRPGAGLAAALTLVGGTVVSVALTHVLLLATTDTAVEDWPVLGGALLRALGVRAEGRDSTTRCRSGSPWWPRCCWR